ncbi:MAG: hypothetical protein EBR60_02040 [Burkholderiaceae bacterium]|nr:hypothetical protein [Burkholderiaceae bacterium]
MSFVIADRVRETTTTTGTGTLSLDGAVAGFQAFTAVGNNNTTYYTIQGTTEWEVGIGTYLSNTLSRDTVLSSSNSGSKVLLTAGTKDVFVTLPAGKTVISVAGKVGEVTLSNTDISGLGTMSTQNANSVTITGGTATLTSLSTPTVQATNSAGLSLKNASGTTQLSMGAGGGDNLTLNVSTNINGSNAQVDISPTGTGHVHMKPTGIGSVEIAPTNTGTLDNLVIGGITPKAITGTTITATSFSGSGSGLTSIPNSALTYSSITINGVATSLGGSVSVGTVTSVSGTSPVSSTGGATPAISLAANYGDTLNPYASKTAKYILAAPNAADGVPIFRAIVASDIPILNQNTTGTASNVTGTVAVANGGTGGTTAADARTNLTAAKSGANTDITSVALTTGTISTAPSASTDIVNKTYADGLAAKWGA